MKKTLIVLLALMVCASFVFAGGEKEAATSATTPAAESAGTSTAAGNVKSGDVQKDVKYRDTVTIGIANDVNNLDPQGSNTDANMMVFYLTHERLVNIDPDTNKVIPALAKSWTVSADGCVYDFTLCDGVTFTNGTPLTAEDVKYTYDKAKTSSFASQKVADVISTEAIDDTHVRVTLAKANQDWLTLMAHGGMSIMSKAACEADPVNGPRMGSGMFSLEEWVPGSHCSFVRYDGYRDGAAPTRKIILKLYKEASTRLIALQTGEIDVCIDPSTTDLSRIKADANLELIQTPNVVMLYMPMQMEKPGLDNVHVRKALAYCMDKDSIVFAAFDGLATVHNNYINRGQFGLNENIHVYEYNLDKAKGSHFPATSQATSHSTSWLTRNTRRPQLSSSRMPARKLESTSSSRRWRPQLSRASSTMPPLIMSFASISSLTTLERTIRSATSAVPHFRQTVH